jgi:hypothetical protein
MDYWLDQIEGDASALLRNQFRLDEQKARLKYRAPLVETRPW